MLSTVQFFELVKARHDLRSDYQLAKFLHISPGLISKHRKTAFGFDCVLGLRLADALKMDPAYVLLCGIVESAKCTEEKRALTRLLVFAELNASQLARGWIRGEMPAER